MCVSLSQTVDDHIIRRDGDLKALNVIWIKEIPEDPQFDDEVAEVFLASRPCPHTRVKSILVKATCRNCSTPATMRCLDCKYLLCKSHVVRLSAPFYRFLACAVVTHSLFIQIQTDRKKPCRHSDTKSVANKSRCGSKLCNMPVHYGCVDCGALLCEDHGVMWVGVICFVLVACSVTHRFAFLRSPGCFHL